MIYLLLFFFGVLAFSISTLTGGGGATLLVPLTSFLIGSGSTAPVVNLGSFIGRPVRLVLFWKSIHWNLVKHYIPFALLGVVVGGWIFTSLDAKWLQLLIGLFLVSTLFQFRFGEKAKSFTVHLYQFRILGFAVTLFSTVVGGLGPLLNPFYLNYGLDKNALMATKTANSFLVGLLQLGTYSFLNALNATLWGYGLALGLGVAVGNYLGKKWLNKMSNKAFRKWVVWAMFFSGILMILKFWRDFY